MKPADRVEFFRRLAAVDPEPKTELAYATPFQLLVAVILSAQATDKSVNLATRDLFRDAPTPQAIAALGEEKLADAIKTIGLYKTKAKNVVATARLLLERHGGEVPHDRAALEALPGVGRKTANVVLNIVFGEPTIAVDTHIFRLANRTGLAPGKDVVAVEKKLLKAVPVEYRLHAHHWLILHGRYVCKARKPECWRCIVRDLCGYQGKERCLTPVATRHAVSSSMPGKSGWPSCPPRRSKPSPPTSSPCIRNTTPCIESADALTREWTPEDGATNPFLHLSLHLAIAEQLSIDQPPGIRAAYESRRAAGRRSSCRPA